LAREYCTSIYGAGQNLFDLFGYPHIFLHLQGFHAAFAIFAVITGKEIYKSGHYLMI